MLPKVGKSREKWMQSQRRDQTLRQESLECGGSAAAFDN
jgi:hypothetical protein